MLFDLFGRVLIQRTHSIVPHGVIEGDTDLTKVIQRSVRLNTSRRRTRAPVRRIARR
jgi:hypothetical protein